MLGQKDFEVRNWAHKTRNCC